MGQLLSRTMFKLSRVERGAGGSSLSPMSQPSSVEKGLQGKKLLGIAGEWQVFDEDRPLSNSNDRREEARVCLGRVAFVSRGDGNKTIKRLGGCFVRRVMPTITSHLRSRRFSFRWWVRN